MKKDKKNKSVQNWLGINKILENGIIELDNGDYVKITKVEPINLLMKTEFEKESILQGFKTLFKTCNFDIQILIQNKKEDLSNNIKLIKEKSEEENNENINEIREKYIKYIKNINLNTESSSKNFFLIIKKEKSEVMDEEIIVEELNDKFNKIKDCLKRCGNEVEEVSEKLSKEIIYSFFNTRKFLISNKEEI